VQHQGKQKESNELSSTAVQQPRSSSGCATLVAASSRKLGYCLCQSHEEILNRAAESPFSSHLA